MRSLIRTTKDWMNKAFVGKTAVGESAPLAELKPPVVPVRAPEAPPADPRANLINLKVTRVIEPDLPKSKIEIPEIFFSGGPLLKITTRGNQIYANCAHCESQWSLRERLNRYKLSVFNINESTPLTCPSCDQAVAIPRSVDLRKLS